MKNLIIAILMAISGVTIAQTDSPIQVYNAGELVFSCGTDTVTINGIFPITMNCINYYTVQYDTSTGVYYFGYGYQQSDGCGRFDQEFSLWITGDNKYYYSYMDSCEGIILFKGDSTLANNFRANNQYVSPYGSNNK